MHRRIVACGRGRVTQLPVIRKEVIALSGKAKPSLVYIGAATYEDNGSFELQTKGFIEDGCYVQHLKLTDLSTIPSRKELEAMIFNTDIVLFSGGNTLFAMNRLRKLKMDVILLKAMQNGKLIWIWHGYSINYPPFPCSLCRCCHVWRLRRCLILV